MHNASRICDAYARHSYGKRIRPSVRLPSVTSRYGFERNENSEIWKNLEKWRNRTMRFLTWTPVFRHQISYHRPQGTPLQTRQRWVKVGKTQIFDQYISEMIEYVSCFHSCILLLRNDLLCATGTLNCPQSFTPSIPHRSKNTELRLCNTSSFFIVGGVWSFRFLQNQGMPRTGILHWSSTNNAPSLPAVSGSAQMRTFPLLLRLPLVLISV